MTTVIISGAGLDIVKLLGLLHGSNIVNEDTKTIVGTSAGGILGFAVLAKLNLLDVKDRLFDKINGRHIYDGNFFAGIMRFLTSSYFFKSDIRYFIIKELFRMAKIDIDITFKKLYRLIPTLFIVNAVSKNNGQMYYFSVDTQPKMKVFDALLATSSLPIIFKPSILTLKDGTTHTFYDGGLRTFYCIQIFDKDSFDYYENDPAKPKAPTVEKVQGFLIQSEMSKIDTCIQPLNEILNTLQIIQKSVTANLNISDLKNTIILNCPQTEAYLDVLTLENLNNDFNIGFYKGKEIA